MKKVLHLLASNKYSGAENVVCTIIENFKDEMEMVYCSPDGPIKEVLENRGIPFFPLKKMSIGQVKKVIKKYQPDIIHAHDYTASVFAALSGFKGKIISHLHINARFAKTWNFKTLLYSFVIKRFDKVIGVSDSVYNEAVFKKKMNKKYVTIYNYVDKQQIIDKSNQFEYGKKYDLFFFGRLNLLKNPFEFIEITKELKKYKKELTAVIVGDGELYDECLNLIKKYNLTENIDLLGFVENPFPIIKNCKICIMPSIVEGFGLTAIESLILGKPVLNSGVGGLKEIFSNYSNLICDNIVDYVDRFVEIQDKNNYDEIVNKYCNLGLWKEKMELVYK